MTTLQSSVSFHPSLESEAPVLINLRTHGEHVSEQIRGWVEDRISSAVEHLGKRAQSVTVFLADENGPDRGGNDKTCRVVVHVAHHTSLVVFDRDSNLSRLVDRVADRLAIAIDRYTSRVKEHRRTRRFRDGGWN